MEELSAEEKVQFEGMQKQEAEEKTVIEAEKQAPETVIEHVQEQQPAPEPKEVPLAALQEERERRKAAEANSRQLELNQARLDERMRIISDRINPPAPPREIPDPDKDALGALKATAEEVKSFREYRERQNTNEQQQRYANEVIAKASSDEAEYMKSTPDYGEASVFLKKSRVEELSALGMNPLQIQQTMASEGLQLADSAIRQGKNPAELVYSLAKSRGYARTAKGNQTQNDTDTDTEKLARIAAGQKANLSLGNMNSTPPKPQISGKDLLAMDDSQFESWLEKLPTKERAKFLGA